MYIYIPFPPFLVTTDHASKRVTREFRSAIEMRAEGKKRAKGKKKKREGRRNNFAGTGILLLLLLRGWDRIFEKHAGKGSGGN